MLANRTCQSAVHVAIYCAGNLELLLDLQAVQEGQLRLQHPQCSAISHL